MTSYDLRWAQPGPLYAPLLLNSEENLVQNNDYLIFVFYYVFWKPSYSLAKISMSSTIELTFVTYVEIDQKHRLNYDFLWRNIIC